ncbi:histidine--tRNA ligase [Candidatus Woesearchaeota archaeon]|nr:histidine--tRNA ligase [Candidatus Woesearchaeota archaeon]
MELQTAKGVRDIEPEEKIVRNKIVTLLTNTFERYGFTPLETPILERYETLAAKFAAGEDSDALKETFKLSDQGERSLGLRFDLTVPLARYMAMNQNMKLPFKRYELGVVFRDGPIKAGRVRQFWQCDIDTVGTSSLLAEAEILALMEEVFKILNLKVILKVNNRLLLNGLLEEAGITEKESALIALDKLDKIGVEGVREELKARKYSSKQIDVLFKFIKPNISLAELKSKINSDEGKEGIQQLEELFSYLKQMGVKAAEFDLSLVRGLAYYTGTVFEAYLKDGKFSSSLAGGGRWDKMIGKFMGSTQDVPAVGVAFGLEPIMEVWKMTNQGKKKTPAKIYVLPINTLNESLKVVQELRSAGINCDFSLGKKGVSKNLEYASALGIPYVVIIGEDELKKKKVLLRDMLSGTEQLLAVKDVVKKLGAEGG